METRAHGFSNLFDEGNEDTCDLSIVSEVHYLRERWTILGEKRIPHLVEGKPRDIRISNFGIRGDFSTSRCQLLELSGDIGANWVSQSEFAPAGVILYMFGPNKTIIDMDTHLLKVYSHVWIDPMQRRKGIMSSFMREDQFGRFMRELANEVTQSGKADGVYHWAQRSKENSISKVLKGNLNLEGKELCELIEKSRRWDSVFQNRLLEQGYVPTLYKDIPRKDVAAIVGESEIIGLAKQYVVERATKAVFMAGTFRQ